MYDSDVLKGTAPVLGERTEWSPKVKLVLAFIIGILFLLPATLGLYWERFLPK